MRLRIEFENVVQRYRVIRERPDSLREAFTKVFRSHSSVQEFQALRGISFQIGDGEVLGLIGRNGSGKSTMLKLIAGVFEPSAGRVQVEGKVGALIELGAGFQPELTGRENIVIGGLVLGYSRKEIEAKEQAIIEFAGLGEFIDSPVKQYSSGMFMRLAFSVATEVDPEILLIDEILAVGDAEFAEKCDQRIRDFRRRNKTILLVSHSMSAMRALCDRAILLDQGKILMDGPTAQVIERYEELVHQPV